MKRKDNGIKCVSSSNDSVSVDLQEEIKT